MGPRAAASALGEVYDRRATARIRVSVIESVGTTS
jgi:hypothetical protein